MILKIYESSYIKTNNTIDLKTETNNISNIHYYIMHQTKYKNNFTNQNAQTDNSNNFLSAPVTASLNTSQYLYQNDP